MRLLSFALAVVVASVAPSYAQAPDAKAEAAAGQKLYTAGQYHDAALKFAHAYELDAQPAFLFDAAQAFRFANECANAAKYYRQFYDIAKQAQAQNLDKVKRYIAEMDQCAKPASPTTGPENPEPAPEPAHVQPPPPEPHQPPPPAITETVPADPGAGKRHLGIALGAVGVAGLVTGFYFTTRVWADNLTCPCTMAEINSHNEQGPKDVTREAVAYSIGGAALAGGVVLYLLGRGQTSEHQMTLAPTKNGAMLSWSF